MCYIIKLYKLSTHYTLHANLTNLRQVVVSCQLPLNSPTQYTFASVLVERNDAWCLWYQTENVNHTLSPHYAKTFLFEVSPSLSEQTKLKFCINNINTSTALGFVITDLRTMQGAKDSKIVAPLQDHAGNANVGEITLELSTSSNNSLPTSHRSLLYVVSNFPSLKLDSHRGFMFQTNHGKIHVSEQLWDHKATISFPLAYIEFLLSKKENILSSYEEFTTLDPVYDSILSKMITHHESSLLDMVGAKKHLQTYDGPLFRKSTQKKESEWQYCPVNLAIYAVGVSDRHESETNYFTSTVGAFTSHATGYKHSLRSTLDLAQKNSIYTAKHDRIMKSIDILYDIWMDIEQYKQVLIDAIALENSNLYDLAVGLTTKISDLTEFCKSPEVLMGVRLMEQGETVTFRSIRERLWSAPEKEYVWDGERYRVKSSSSRSDSYTSSQKQETETCITVAITNFILAVEKKGASVGKEMLKMLASLEPLVTQSRQGLMFILLLEENKIFNSAFQSSPEIEIRMNHSFSQGLSAVYATFYTTLLDAFTRGDDAYFGILCNTGILIQFQSLLSTYAAELVMLEDHWIVVNNLSHCTFVLTPHEFGDFSLSGLAYRVTISFGVGNDIWEMLPSGLKDGKPIPINTMLFTKGVNEQQMLAEKVGTTSMEHTINLDALCKLEVYFMLFKEHVQQTNIPVELAKLEALMETISKHARAHIYKDIKLLCEVDELVRLMSGCRVTSCKSAKDRTGMSVTYETASVLTRDHELLTSTQTNALDALRSHGVRPLNCKKNTGSSKYAFNGFQLKILPKEYRPPIGTYGGKIT